jgi:ribosomal protein L16 Arg81 hydroxylase
MKPQLAPSPFALAPQFTLARMVELLASHREIILGRDEYVSLRFYLNGKEELIDLELFFQQLEQGKEQFLKAFPYSFRLTNVQNLDPHLKTNCHELAQLKGGAITSNLYFTPGQHRNCFLYHSDPQDSFVLHVLGKKHWSFALQDSQYVQDFSLSHYGFEKVYGKDFDQTQSFHLTPGSFLEIPYGCIHKAEIQGSEPAIHLNFALTYPTRIEFMQFIFGHLATPWGLEDKGYERMTDQTLMQLAQELAPLLKIENVQDLVRNFQLMQLKKTHVISRKGRSYAHRFKFGLP